MIINMKWYTDGQERTKTYTDIDPASVNIANNHLYFRHKDTLQPYDIRLNVTYKIDFMFED